MSRSKYGQPTLSGLVDSDSEDAFPTKGMPTPESGNENMAPAKKGRGRPKAAPTKVTKVTKVPKAKASARRTSDRMTLNKRAPTAAGKAKRQVLSDKTNQQNDSDTEEVDNFEPIEDVCMEGDEQGYKASAAAVGKTRKTKKVPVKQTASAPKEILNTVVAKEPRQKSRTTKKAIVRVEVPEEASPEKYVPETQVAAMEVDQPNEREEVEEVVAKKSSKSAQSRSVHRQPQPVQRPRAGSASDTERGDPNLRRKLGELSKKYDVLNTRYQDLREIGVKEAERNFERLRKQMEEKTKIANELIGALKADLVVQTALAMDSQAEKKRVATFQAQISQLTTLLSESQIENKALSAKLAANRTTAASVESVNAKIPGSAVKAGGIVRMMGTAEAAQVARAAQLKEDLYSDLTGLIMRSVKRDTEEDVFDCIQTGRNGTLHFKLAVANEKSADSYEDAQCTYVPQLDPSRDKSLMELLPDYLVEEITFPRPQAAKFFARVVTALTEKPA